ncbi:ketohexokinase [Drosophila guanche]|uniref:Blast:Ketohexokinase n=1 Tax=Drosophila guanche TaxID=7266 RepID=A0A3B0JUN1_DROGU|nr:ketohexokinase [Drosophila guanche]SPP77066.1 blast:Ketohexokinase [Drosophila guanche]
MSHPSALSLQQCVLCVGCTEIAYVSSVAQFPARGARLRCQSAFMQRTGRTSNVCTALRLLGARVELFGVLSRSGASFRFLVDDLRRRDIDFSHCPWTDESPSCSSIIRERETGTSTVLRCGKLFPYVTAKQFAQLDLFLYGWVHFEARHARETVLMMRRVLDHNNGRAEQDRIVVSLLVYDSLEDHLDLLSLCDFVVFGRLLALQLGWSSAHNACEQLNSALRTPRSIHTRRPCIICPWGSQGAVCMDARGKLYELPAYRPRKIVDRLGDGECFTAGFIYATFVRRRHLPDAVDFANLVASHKIASVGFDDIAQLRVSPRKLLPVPLPDSEVSSEDEQLSHEQRLCRKYLNRPIQLQESPGIGTGTGTGTGTEPEPASKPMSEQAVEAAWERLSRTAY